MQTFEARLGFALRIAGLSRGQLDRLMGWQNGCTKKLLVGDVERPPSRIVLKLADVLSVDPDWLEGGTVSTRARKAVDEARRVLDASHVSDEDRRYLLDLLRAL